MTEMAKQTSLNRSRSITEKFRRFQKSMLRPFALATRAPLSLAPHYTNSGGGSNSYPYEATPVDGGFSTVTFDNGHLNTNFDTNGITIANLKGQTQAPNHNQTHHRDTSLTSQPAHRAHATTRQPSEPSYLSKVMRSDTHGTGDPKGDTLSLPFRLSISHLHSKTQRNIPYLRQSWTRIDFLAIICFWVTFGLATTGFEHGSGGLHIGVFRAISVIRITRLLSVTSGTTVSFPFLEGKALVIDIANSLFLLKSSKTIMHSLKTARPLLASVAYFVVFAMVLFSYVLSFLISLKFFIIITSSPLSTNPTSI